MEANKKCRICGDDLVVGENWRLSMRKSYNYICKTCHNKRSRIWLRSYRERMLLDGITNNRISGRNLVSNNRSGVSYMGICVAGDLLRRCYKHVQAVVNNKYAYKFVCDHDKFIDVKSSCLGKNWMWLFSTRRNTVVDFFICVAFDDRDDPNVMHVWMIPGEKLNPFMSASISPSSVDKWSEYEQDIDEILS